jgi:hypothetical protein
LAIIVADSPEEGYLRSEAEGVAVGSCHRRILVQQLAPWPSNLQL